MKSKAQFIEALEPRIAPALLVSGGNLLGGSGNPSTGETSTGNNTVTLVKVITGQALVFFDNGHIVGISVGKHTKLDITGDVLGDIVTNLGPDGRLTDSDGKASNGEDGGLLTNYGIKGITTHPLSSQMGSIGRIIAGGQVNNVNVAGQIGGIYAGDGIFRDGSTATVNVGTATALNTVDINPIVIGTQSIFTFHQGDSAPNGNAAVKNVTVATAAHLEVFAGSGSSGGAGSGITNVTIAATLASQGDQPAVFLHAGDGGANTGSGNGGAGGSITSFNDQGSTAYVKLQTGGGGSATSGNGGDGGSLLTSTISSSSTRYDLLMGVGGSGQHGGAGGSIQTLSFTNTVNGGKSLVATADLNNDGVADVILLNTLTGESVVSLGSAVQGKPDQVSFAVAAQAVPQADGTQLQTPFLPSEGNTPTSLVVTDLNHDGLPDFVVGYSSTDSLGIYTNHGAGQFTASRLNLTVSPTNLVAGDFSGTGLGDLAIVSSAAATTNTGGPLSEVFIAHDSAAGNLTVDTTPIVSIGGVSTAVAGTSVHDTTGAAIGVNLYVGLQSGDILPVVFRGGGATLGSDIAAFRNAAQAGDPNSVPVDSIDAIEGSLLAFSQDINATKIKNGDTTAVSMAEVKVYGVNASGTVVTEKDFNPTLGTTNAQFIGGSALVGTAAPEALSIWGIQNTTLAYGTLNVLASDGALNNFASLHLGDTYQIAASGAASNRFFFTEGTPGSTTGVDAFVAQKVPFRPRVISFETGAGGNGDTLMGGDGGAIKGLTYTESLGAGVLEAGGAYSINLTTGDGGTSNASTGGSGGGMSKSILTLNPAYYTHDQVDDTTTATFQTGAGGQGTTGGDGGSLSKVSSTTVFSNFSADGAAIDAVALRLFTGNGGVGTASAGGAGGSIILAGQPAINGVSFVDPDSASFAQTPGLEVKAGNGGQGATAGGVGGSLTSIGSQNVQVSGQNVAINELINSTITSGSGGAATGGNGGAGGLVTSTNVAVAGSIEVSGGGGGVGHGGHGGKGGMVTSSTVGAVSGDASRGFGVLVHGGVGGDGDLGGGNGGGIKQVNVNSPSEPEIYAAAVMAGNGGNALSNGTGGKGGNVSAIAQTKDVNSAINVIQAGNGGAGVGNGGGIGGSVKNVNTAGFIGLPSTDSSYPGVFYEAPYSAPDLAGLFSYSQVPQGLFAGQGADGAANGSVLNVVARQIAAISASVQANGHFAAANTVDNIKADVIGYDVPGQAIVSPASNVPIDGFILAATVTNINTQDSGLTSQHTFTS